MSVTPLDRSPPYATSTRASVPARRMLWAGGVTGAPQERTDSARKDANVSCVKCVAIIDMVIRWDTLQLAIATTRVLSTPSAEKRTDSADAPRTLSAAAAMSARQDSGTFQTASPASVMVTLQLATQRYEVKSNKVLFKKEKKSKYYFDCRRANVLTAEIGPLAYTARSALTGTMATLHSR